MSSRCLQYEFNPLHRNGGVSIDRGQVSGSETGKFAPPSGIGDFDIQNSVGKPQRAGAIGHGASAHDRPREDGAFGGGSPTQRAGNNVFEAVRSAVQRQDSVDRVSWEDKIVAPANSCGGGKLGAFFGLLAQVRP